MKLDVFEEVEMMKSVGKLEKSIKIISCFAVFYTLLTFGLLSTYVLGYFITGAVLFSPLWWVISFLMLKHSSTNLSIAKVNLAHVKLYIEMYKIIKEELN